MSRTGRLRDKEVQKNERKEEDNVFDAIQLSARQTHLLILSSLQLTVKFALVDLPQRNPVVSITFDTLSLAKLN